jgi:hypothetical protein
MPMPFHSIEVAPMAIDYVQVAMIESQLRNLGDPPWRAKFMANRLYRGFAADAIFVVKAFLRAGWTLDDVYMLDQISREWRKAPQQVLLLEKMLLAFGLWENFARRLAMEPILYSCHDFAEIGTKIHLFRGLGLSDKDILDIGLRKPAVLLMPPDQIKAWHAQALQDNKNPRFVTKRLKPLPANKSPQPLPIPESWKEAAVESSEPEPPAAVFDEESMTGFAILAPLRDVLQLPAPAPSVAAPMSAKHEPTPPITPKAENSEPPELTEELAAPSPKVELTAVVPKMLAGRVPESDMAKVETTTVCASKPALPMLNPSFADGQSVTHSLPEPPDDEDVEAPVFAPETTSPDAPEDDSLGWLGLAKKILSNALTDWDNDDWRIYSTNHPWVLLSNCAEIQAMRLLAAWFDISRLHKPGDPKSIFLASFMLGRNLPQEHQNRKRRIKISVLKRKQTKAKGIIAYEIRKNIRRLEKTIATVEKQAPELYHLLSLPTEIIYLRLYALRSILQHKTLLRHPEAVLLPFERVQTDATQTPRRLSIPPPDGSDIAQLQAKAQELRFRAHQIESFGQEPWRQPYLDMLLEPTRAKFLQRLEKFVARKQQKDDSSSSIGALHPRPPYFIR